MAQVFIAKGQRALAVCKLEGGVVSLTDVVSRAQRAEACAEASRRPVRSTRKTGRQGRKGLATDEGREEGRDEDASRRSERDDALKDVLNDALLVRAESPLVENAETWALVVGVEARARVNGSLVATGIKALDHGDELAIGGLGTFHFSTETCAVIEPFPGVGRHASCARCQDELVEGRPAVRCPNCGAWHHQETAPPGGTLAAGVGPASAGAAGMETETEEDEPASRVRAKRLCWTYDEHCATPGCDWSTNLDGRLHWTPEDD